MSIAAVLVAQGAAQGAAQAGAKITEAGAIDILAALALAGLLGMAGQAVRAVGGLKKMSDEAQRRGVRPFDLLVPSRLVISLMIGFVAGMIAAYTLDIRNLIPLKFDNTQFLLGIAAAGYAGTDFLEAFVRNLAGRARAQLPSEMQIVVPPPEFVPLPSADAPPARAARKGKRTAKKSRRAKGRR